MNKYEIIGIVGEGAYGIVYKAKNKDTGQFGKSHVIINLFSGDKKIQRIGRRGPNCEEDYET
jgi:serine/threonine protein kinase